MKEGWLQVCFGWISSLSAVVSVFCSQCSVSFQQQHLNSVVCGNLGQSVHESSPRHSKWIYFIHLSFLKKWWFPQSKNVSCLLLPSGISGVKLNPATAETTPKGREDDTKPTMSREASKTSTPELVKVRERPVCHVLQPGPASPLWMVKWQKETKSEFRIWIDCSVCQMSSSWSASCSVYKPKISVLQD